ncbi:MAG: peptidoglycan bridge formation glycyltransferase FemA/FemB family protein [Planctomycetes bacterium]|nr:peptidoglycan bridge formation glycyltransferase FemA/FemB family protein [Planctomycetota bacterium]
MTDGIRMIAVENRNAWNDLLFKCEKANLLQTWEYGEAKKNAEGWIPIRSLVIDENKPIGITQMLVKKIPLLGEIVRINRAPLIFSKDRKVCSDTTVGILQFFYHYWVIQRKLPLFVAPNIMYGEICDEILTKMGFCHNDENRWASITIDLFLDEATLRKNLHQKWRNLLNKSEKGELKLEIDNSEDGWSFLMSKYKQLMIEKNFSGITERLLLELRNVAKDASSVQVMFACKDGERIGGVLIIGCVDTCHYLVGWNNTEGRIFQSNYFLLWQAVLIFKKMGFRWFDLGGINERLTPGITHFKRGTGGKEYTLIGELEAFPGTVFSLVIKQIAKLKLRKNNK